MPNQLFDYKSVLKQLTQRPGVYQMLAENGSVLYVGKAKNLKNRVSSYFKKQGLHVKTAALVAKIAGIDVTVTETEIEALILEQNLIKQYRPPYNILLRDDKSYPYIFLSDGDFPRLSYHRGAKREKGTYFGPYPNASSVRETMALLQRVFKVRQCEDSFYANRTRPCLQYQIKRCTAPCVGLVSKEEYAEQVRHTRLFLEGKSDELLHLLADKMEKAAEQLDFEQAAVFRDQIQHLQRVVESQYIETGQAQAQVDVFAISCRAGLACVHALFIRGGRVLGSKSFYPKLPLDSQAEDALMAFLAQYYFASQHEIPSRVFLSHEIEEVELLQQALSNKASRQIHIQSKPRGAGQQRLQLALDTAEQNVSSRLASRASMLQRFKQLQKLLELEMTPERIECFDISHSSGEATVASCVVFNQQGPLKSDYRKFNIDDITAGDDYAAMEQALMRRFKRLKQGEGRSPDVLLIDGGKGQVGKALEVLHALEISDILVLGVIEGANKGKAGQDTLVLAKAKQELALAEDSPALHLVQYIRDEAHRFAVKAHTQRRDKVRKQSQLEGIPGIGAKRRRDLLRYFGSVKAVTEAPVRELVKVTGISEKIAQDIYAHFHHE